MRILYVDDERMAIQMFLQTLAELPAEHEVHTAQNAQDALTCAREHPIDVALLDIELPGMRGLELAKALRAIHGSIRVVFVTAYDEYALEAFGVDALGYLLKPYTAEALARELDKARRMRNIPAKVVYIQTIPTFDVYIDGELLPIGSHKPKELLALLVDRNGGSVTPGQAISLLWEDRDNDSRTKALYRMTVKRLREILLGAGIDFIMNAEGSQRFVVPETFACDYFRFLNGDEETIAKYNGEYMSEYSWAEETNARLLSIKAGTQRRRARR